MKGGEIILQSRKINFKHHDLLTVQMLEQMQTSALGAALAPYITYADGIIAGLSVSMDELGQIHIMPGTVKWHGQIYMLTEKYIISSIGPDCKVGWVVLLPTVDRLEVAFTTEQPEEIHIVLAMFSKRDVGSVVRQVDQLKKLRFINYFDASVVKIAGADGLLTYHAVIAQCFARELLVAPGADAVDYAFAWQALAAPPTQTMWTHYFKRHAMEWTEEGSQLLDRLLAILKKKEKPIQTVVQPIEVEQSVTQREQKGIRVD